MSTSSCSVAMHRSPSCSALNASCPAPPAHQPRSHAGFGCVGASAGALPAPGGKAARGGQPARLAVPRLVVVGLRAVQAAAQHLRRQPARLLQLAQLVAEHDAGPALAGRGGRRRRAGALATGERWQPGHGFAQAHAGAPWCDPCGRPLHSGHRRTAVRKGSSQRCADQSVQQLHAQKLRLVRKQEGASSQSSLAPGRPARRPRRSPHSPPARWSCASARACAQGAQCCTTGAGRRRETLQAHGHAGKARTRAGRSAPRMLLTALSPARPCSLGSVETYADAVSRVKRSSVQASPEPPRLPCRHAELASCA